MRHLKQFNKPQVEDFGLRNRSEIDGTRKQYSGPEDRRIWSVDTGKVRGFFGSEYCFRVPLISEAFLPDPASTLRPPTPLLIIVFGICFSRHVFGV